MTAVTQIHRNYQTIRQLVLDKISHYVPLVFQGKVQRNCDDARFSLEPLVATFTSVLHPVAHEIEVTFTVDVNKRIQLAQCGQTVARSMPNTVVDVFTQCTPKKRIQREPT